MDKNKLTQENKNRNKDVLKSDTRDWAQVVDELHLG